MAGDGGEVRGEERAPTTENNIHSLAHSACPPFLLLIFFSSLFSISSNPYRNQSHCTHTSASSPILACQVTLCLCDYVTAIAVATYASRQLDRSTEIIPLGLK